MPAGHAGTAPLVAGGAPGVSDPLRSSRPTASLAVPDRLAVVAVVGCPTVGDPLSPSGAGGA
ncbi:hypothetical protein, partial [Oerskovia enterophila]|uniref:hypothetical protein n=1 Tax=Oerskovia enterophila TaxID=43678 RepID=UPI000A5C34E1